MLNWLSYSSSTVCWVARGSTGMRLIPDAAHETKVPKQPQPNGQPWAQEDLTNTLNTSTTTANDLQEARPMSYLADASMVLPRAPPLCLPVPRLRVLGVSEITRLCAMRRMRTKNITKCLEVRQEVL